MSNPAWNFHKSLESEFMQQLSSMTYKLYKINKYIMTIITKICSNARTLNYAEILCLFHKHQNEKDDRSIKFTFM